MTTIDLCQEVEKAILREQLLADNERVLVAVSGGVDSMVLLDLLQRLAGSHGWSLALAHFNHQLRGREANADERLVERTAARLGLPFHAGRADVRSLARRARVSVEMAARQSRHEFLARTARKCRSRKVALAHHADDQVELFFLRLLRGAGPEGLAGMSAIGPSPVDAGVRLIRPVLELARAQLLQYANERGIHFRQDATNKETDYERNRIRHKLLPFLRRHFQSSVDRSVIRVMHLLRGESDFIAQACMESLTDDSIAFDQRPLAMQRRRLRFECHRLGVAPDFELIEKLRSTAGQQIMVSPDRVLWRDVQGCVYSRLIERARFDRTASRIELAGSNGRALFKGMSFSWRIQVWRGWPARTRKRAQGYERFDADKVGARVLLRHWRPGDRFQPIGMPASVKVQDLFTNRRVPRGARSNVVVGETANGEIFWIEGLRISERFKIDAHTKRCLVWQWRLG
jgi:tRNA(Ile)-lysidine synthase